MSPPLTASDQPGEAGIVDKMSSRGRAPPTIGSGSGLASCRTGNLDSMETGFADELARYTGRWVALDYGRRRVVADADSKSSLLARLNVENVRGAVILEVPLPDAPSLIGLG